MRKRLDFPSRVRGSLAAHPAIWMIGSLASGLFASALFRRRPRVTTAKHRGAMLGLLGLTLTAAKPLAKVWLANQFKDWVTRARPASPAPRPLPRSQSF